MCTQIGGGEAETTLNACARDSEVSDSRRSTCLRFSKMKPRGVQLASWRAASPLRPSATHARACGSSSVQRMPTDRFASVVTEASTRSFDYASRRICCRVRLGGDSPVERSRKVSTSLDLSPLLRCAIDEATRIDRSRRAGRCVWLRADLLAGLQPRRRPGTALYWFHGR